MLAAGIASEAYFADLGRIHASGGATGERSSYGPLANLLSVILRLVFLLYAEERHGRRGGRRTRPRGPVTTFIPA